MNNDKSMINKKLFIYYQLFKYILKWKLFLQFYNNLGCDIVFKS